ncbi:MAG: hypothetical protein K2M45_06530 [Muribaculaceae bacterium]|nr:hypothetical protein [Muribaculaceae bacterium]
MKIIHNRLIPFGKRYYAINLFGIIFAKGKCSAVTINHEAIHTAQMRELLYIPFYLFYLLEWLIRLVQYRSFYQAYLNISFEREAYAYERDLSYLSSRPRFQSFRRLLRR